MTDTHQAAGKFVTVEGQDGAGKTSNIAYIAELLSAAGKEVVRTREPGGTHLGERLRELILHGEGQLDAMAELLLVFAARAQHLADVIEPALTSGKWVLCDRFTDATYAYQGAGRGVDAAAIEAVEQIVQGTRRPDLTLLLDVDPRLADRRLSQTGPPDRFEAESTSFKQRVRSAYMERASQEPKRVHLIDASRTLPEVRDQIRRVITRMIRQ